MENEHDDGGPAFPMQDLVVEGHVVCGSKGQSLRAYAAIHLRVPNSGIAWLDEMIRESRRHQIAGQALAGMSWLDSPNTYTTDAECCYRMTDEMLKARIQCEPDTPSATG